MKLLAEISGERARAMAGLKPPFGPGFESHIATRIEVLKLHCSEFRDEGDDFCEFVGLDRSGTIVAKGKMGGF